MPSDRGEKTVPYSVLQAGPFPLRRTFVLFAEWKSGSRAFAEVYVLTPGETEPRGRQLACQERDTALVDLRYEAEQWALGELETQLLDWHAQRAPTAPLPDFAPLAPTGSPPLSALAHLWGAGQYTEQLQAIHRATGCAGLQADLKRVFDLSPIAVVQLPRRP